MLAIPRFVHLLALVCLLAAPLLTGCGPSGPEFRSVLWYEAPARDWSSEALPIGNGRLGAMVFGDPFLERIQLNEDSMWPGGPDWGDAKGTRSDLEEVRRMLVDGDVHEADKAWVDRFSHLSIIRSHQTMGDLWLDFGRDSSDVILEYRRQLDLDSALVTVNYSTSEGAYTERVFTSHPADAIIVELSTTAKQGLSFDIAMSRPLDKGQETVSVEAISESELVMDGIVTQYGGRHFSEPTPIARGVKFQTRLKTINTGGLVRSNDGMLEVRNAQHVVLQLVAATSFYEDDVINQNQFTLAALDRLSIDELLEQHVEDHQALFHRVELDLGGHELDSVPTNQRLTAMKEGASDVGLTALEFQFGRYLLIASSRPGTNPANLQGLWNEYIEAPWNADYHLNINLQMNYWLAEVTNLTELHEPLFDFTERLLKRGKKTAQQQYGMRGSVAHHATDLWTPAWMRAATPYWGAWVGGGGWLSQHFWEHYQFTKDEDFLRARAYPVLSQNALFYLDWLMLDERDGTWVSAPSTSPENSYTTSDGGTAATVLGSAIDQQIITEVFTNSLSAAQVLGIEDELTSEIRNKLAGMRPGVVLGSDGRILEWDREYEEPEPGHRHMSHLYALHPGVSITKTTPEWFDAAAKTADFRLENGGAGTGWSRAWLINMSARLFRGSAVGEHINLFFQKSVSNNLFDMHPPFQIDGNFGFTAGVAEALIQSHAKSIELLPALPPEWPNGNVSGLKARGNVEVLMVWKEGVLQKAEAKAAYSGNYTFEYAGEVWSVSLTAGRTTEVWSSTK